MGKDISAGIAFLDEKHPGWEWEIDLTSLAMVYPCRCIVGQLFEGGYSVGAVELGFDVELESVELGFATERGDWAELTEAWVVEIERRRALAYA